ncbi:MAG: patatin-like phospholipase family protein, partial [Longimicrobiales bacterium]
VTGEAVVLDSGDFARAARASMAVPGVFAPIMERGRVLADGGVASYLPVGIARAAGASRVIAVDVLRPSADLGSTDPITLAFRAVRLTLRNTLTANDSPTFLIAPDISQRFSAAYFPRRPDHLIAAGLSAAQSSLPQATGVAAAQRSAQPPPTSFSELEIESFDAALSPLVRSAFRDVPLDRYDPRAIQRAVDRLYATGLFGGVWPNVEKGAGTAVLIVRADAAAPTRAAGAVGYDNDRGGRIWASVRNRLESGPLEIAALGSYGTLEAIASAEARGVLNFAPSLAWTLGGGYRETEIRIFDGDNIDGERDVSRTGGWLGLQWRSIVRERDAAITLVGEHVYDEDGEDGASVGAALRFDETGTPARVVGVPVLLEAEARFGEVGYQSAQFAGSIDGGTGDLLVAAAARIGIASDDAPPDALFALGDDHWIPGLRWGDERGRALVAAGFDVAYPTMVSGYIRLRVRAGFAGDSFDDADSAERWVAGAGLAGVWHVVVGTIELGAAVTDRGDWRLELNLGPVF